MATDLDKRIRQLQKDYGLSVQQSEIYALYERGNISTTKLAAKMGIKQGSVSSALKAARDKIARQQ